MECAKVPRGSTFNCRPVERLKTCYLEESPYEVSVAPLES